MKGIIASAFADLAKIGESGAFVLPQENQYHSLNKMQVH
jgi:hypothetical protein